MLPSTPLYTQCQSVMERHFHLHHRLLDSPSPPSETAGPSLALDLSRLDVELQALILSLAHHNSSTSPPALGSVSCAQEQQSVEVVAEMQRVSGERNRGGG